MKNEGTFLLRYRVFNIYSKACGTTEIPILAECYGGPFKIYSTKEFPGLRASTDLTKVRRTGCLVMVDHLIVVLCSTYRSSVSD